MPRHNVLNEYLQKHIMNINMAINMQNPFVLMLLKDPKNIKKQTTILKILIVY